MALYSQSIAIQGHGSFPIDMLRYDSCYPDSSEDASKIHDSLEKFESKTIRVRRLVDSKKKMWTFDRWKSFGWTFVEGSEQGFKHA